MVLSPGYVGTPWKKQGSKPDLGNWVTWKVALSRPDAGAAAWKQLSLWQYGDGGLQAGSKSAQNCPFSKRSGDG